MLGSKLIAASAANLAGGGGGGGVGLVAPYHFSIINAVNYGATGLGTYTGTTGPNVNSQEDTYRHGGFSGSAIFEWYVNTGFTGGDVMFGILDATHWNATPSYDRTTGKRAMKYCESLSSYGSVTGTTLIDSAGYNTPNGSGTTLGLVWNEANGRLKFYNNGTQIFILQNTGFIGITKYPAVSHWYYVTSGTTMLTTPSAYASSYTLP